MSAKREPKYCPRCGVDIRPFDPRNRNTYCSRRCSKLTEMPTKDCAHCGKTFSKPRNLGYDGWSAIRHCSKKCSNATTRKRKTLICRGCGIDFNSSSGHVDRLFCNQACYWRTMRTERFPVAGPRYKLSFTRVMKRHIRERDGECCAECGATDELEYDHVLAVFLGGENTIENGQILCRPCHRAKTTSELRKAA